MLDAVRSFDWVPPTVAQEKMLLNFVDCGEAQSLFDCQQSFSADEILEARSPNPLEIPVIDAQKIVVVQ